MPPPRTILYTGKGGVGKTSVAAATACRCAAAGLRTVILSTDPAHSLADSLQAPLGPHPSPAPRGPPRAPPRARSAARLGGREGRPRRERGAKGGAVASWLSRVLADR